ncbi:MAG: leucine-rich repeat domain-containing protein, partial [Clostridia bacterium]|nr:leucine-rich repeat domain-containing protein [Clostridia bacterium]
MKKIISLFLILTLITGIGAFVPAVSAAASGTCGPNLTWTLDNNGKLTVSGTGGMDEWLNNTSVPWYSYHDQIKTIVIGEGVTNIGFGAIFAFSELTSIKIPTTVSSIDKMSFAHSCRKLQTVTVTSGNPYYVSTNGILYNKDKTILVKYPAAKTATSFTVPSTVTTISNGAFDYAAALKSVTLPSGLKDIDSSAFQLCTGLSSITLPEGLEGVGSYTFDGTAITSIVFPASVWYINNAVCRNCTNLTTATIKNPECRAWGWQAYT